MKFNSHAGGRPLRPPGYDQNDPVLHAIFTGMQSREWSIAHLAARSGVPRSVLYRCWAGDTRALRYPELLTLLEAVRLKAEVFPVPRPNIAVAPRKDHYRAFYS